MVLLKFVSALLLFASAVMGALSIIEPSSQIWWIAKSDNELRWTCKSSNHTQFTVLLNNQNLTILPAPLAFIAIQYDYDCSLIIKTSQVDQPPHTGYFITFGNTLNNTEVWATSEPFEIKSLGSAYPDTSSILSSVTGTASGPTSSPTGNSTTTDTKKSGSVPLLDLKAGSVGAMVLAAIAASLFV